MKKDIVSGNNAFVPLLWDRNNDIVPLLWDRNNDIVPSPYTRNRDILTDLNKSNKSNQIEEKKKTYVKENTNMPVQYSQTPKKSISQTVYPEVTTKNKITLKANLTLSKSI